MKYIIEKIKKAENIVITAHISEDADALGSSFALASALRDMEKTVTVVLSDEPEQRCRFMKQDYVVFGDGFSAPQDLLVCLDCATKERLGARAVLLEKSESVAIDHHFTNTGYADLNYVEGDASSTGEIIFKLLKAMGIKPTKEVAEFLYAAISADTGSFQYSSTSPDTMRIVAELMETGIDHAEIARNLFDRESSEVLKLKGHLMQNVESYLDGRLSMVVLSDAQFKSFGVSEKDSGDIVNIARMSRLAEVAVSVRETPEKIKISFRSNGKANVSDIAAHFGGGGHKMAAGASVTGKTPDAVRNEIIKVVGEYLDD